jgi:hypothetical protein
VTGGDVDDAISQTVVHARQSRRECHDRPAAVLRLAAAVLRIDPAMILRDE